MKKTLTLSAVMTILALAPNFAHAQNQPIDVFYKTTGGQIDRESGIFFEWEKALPSPNASAVDAKYLVVRQGESELSLNVQMDYNGADFASCQEQQGTHGSWKNDVTNESVISWHESMICRNIEFKGNRHDYLVRLDIEGENGTIEVKDIRGTKLVEMMLKRK